MISDTQLGWLLADTAADVLSKKDRAALFVELGADEAILAIERVLTAAAATGSILEWGLLHVIDEWLNRYTGFSHEARIRQLVRGLRARGISTRVRSRRPVEAPRRVRRLAMAGTARAPGRQRC